MADSLARLGSMFEQAKDLTIEAAMSASARLSETPQSLRPQEISTLLNSRSDRDIVAGMKCVVSLISRGEDGLPYFADVVKNVTTHNQHIRNLVLVYLTRYAEVEPDIALLSINSIQKSLNDTNPIHRSRSIRSLAGIRIASILPILVLSIKRTSSDPSPVVRTASAVAIGQIYVDDDPSASQLLELLARLLADSSTQVVAAAVRTFHHIHHDIDDDGWRYIHGNFRRICRLLPQFDEWTQVVAIELGTAYCRRFLPQPTLTLATGEVINLPQYYHTFSDYTVDFDHDLQLFLSALKPLAHTNSDAVLLAATRSLLNLAPPSTLVSYKYHLALTRAATAAQSSQFQFVALELIARICRLDYSVFSERFRYFFVFPNDSDSVASAKLAILTTLSANPNIIKYIVEELKHYALHYNNDVVADASIRALGSCCQVSEEWNNHILAWALRQVQRTSGSLLNQLLNVVRLALHHKMTVASEDPKVKSEIVSTLYKLSLLLQGDMEGEAKATMIWMIGDMTVYTKNQIGPDVLRQQIATFADQSEDVRYQLLMLAAKVFSFELDRLTDEIDDTEELQRQLDDNRIHNMFKHVLYLAKYDNSYDTRDRARMIDVLLNRGPQESKLASLFLQVPKPFPEADIGAKGDQHVDDYITTVPDWADPATLPDSSVREEIPVVENQITSFAGQGDKRKSPSPGPLTGISSADVRPPPAPLPPMDKGNGNHTGYKLQSLDEFFGSDDDESESEEGSSEDSGLSSSDEEEDDEEDDDDEEEEDDDDSHSSDESERGAVDALSSDDDDDSDASV
ncbi:hypothetical protein DIURU_005349 [Diutina rugosa]|uniref:Clathrin/coatomer adaptor adaptin-like N-terminal domain-containing protein n=1 Tax=Diutina rugosa TaxID=5481 RepID=A0A642UE40_DIURU|nr:uncharacterized protein DIURU_005349 [Diutina rugosa]KAA8897372.1 hypothetical protein DIURU_005349 [Diutina rugosa]